SWLSTSDNAGTSCSFSQWRCGDESAAAGEHEVFSTGGGESIDDLLSRLRMAGTGRGGARSTRSGATGPGRPAAQGRLAPIEVTAEVTLEEAFHGTSRIVDIDGRRLEVTIPRGVNSGSRIRLTG